MLTDRDIVVEAVAKGKSLSETKAGELGDGKPVTIGADDSVEEALSTMIEHTLVCPNGRGVDERRGPQHLLWHSYPTA